MATVGQLETSGSQLDGIPPDLEDSIRFAGARLTQAAGILLRLPQEAIAQAIVVFMRFWTGPEGGSLAEFGAEVLSRRASRKYTRTNHVPASVSILALPHHQAICIPEISAKSYKRIHLPHLPSLNFLRPRTTPPEATRVQILCI